MIMTETTLDNQKGEFKFPKLPDQLKFYRLLKDRSIIIVPAIISSLKEDGFYPEHSIRGKAGGRS